MQTTLLGLAIAVILALVAALVGPLVIDWGQFRSTFEAEATRLAGQPVRIAGQIDARLLPTPSLKLGDIAVGGDRPTLKAREISMEFALGPMMRGEFRAVQMRIAGPELTGSLDAGGRFAMPGAAGGLGADAFSIEKLAIEDGRLVLADAASQSRLTLEKFVFNGEVRSLSGPYRGEGAFVSDGALYGYRVVTGRADNAGAKVKVSLEPADRPLTVEADGIWSAEGGSPRFDGALTMARAAGAAAKTGQSTVSEPWRVAARVKANAASALFEQLELQYGPDERAMKLAGTAEFKFGRNPRFDGVLSARRFDIDRLVATPEAPRPLPAAALRNILANFGEGGVRPAVPVKIGIGIDALMLGGSVIQNLRGDIKAEGASWSLEGFELRAPGLTQINFSGRIDASPAGIDFAGPVDVSATDPRLLLAWLEGDPDSTSATARPLKLRGDVAFGKGRIAIERLRAEVERKTFEGRLAYLWAADGKPARLDAEVRAAELDIDSMVSFGKASSAGLKIDRPGEVALALAIGRATIAGIEARNATAKLKYDGGGLEIERLSVADFGGTALNASGKIDTSKDSPRGTLTVDVDSRNLSGLAAIAERYLPDSAETARRITAQLAPAKLRATLDVESAASPKSSAKLLVVGNAGATWLNVTLNASGDPASPAAADIRLDGRIAADDGNAVLNVLGLNRLVSADKRVQQFTLAANGPLGGDLRVDAKLIGETEAAASGTVRLSADKGATGTLNLVVSKADFRRLRPASGGRADPLPATLSGRIALAGSNVALNDLVGTFAGARLRGNLAVDLSARSFDGRLDADRIDLAPVLASVVGAPSSAARPAVARPAAAPPPAWPAEPFQAGLWPEATGNFTFSAARVILSSTLSIGDLRTTMRLQPAQIVLSEIQGDIVGGRFSGDVTLRKGPEGLTGRGHLALAGTNAGLIIPGDGAIAGKLNLQVEGEATGLSPRAFMGSIAGTGMIRLENAEIAGLDPTAFAAMTRALDQGLPLEANRIRVAMTQALDAGRLRVAQTETPITITAGQIRVGNMVVRGEGADVAVTGSVDLSDSGLDARLALTGAGAADATARPEVNITLKGPVSAPQRNVDVAALAGWLALRSVEQQAKKLEEAERLAAQRAREEAERARNEEAERAARAREEAERNARLREELARLREEQQRARDEAAAARARDAASRPAAPTPPEIAAGAPREAAPPLPPPAEIRPVGDPPVRPRPPARQPTGSLAPPPGFSSDSLSASSR